MNFPSKISRIFVALVCLSSSVKADLWGGKSQDSFEVTYELIQGVKLKTYSTFTEHPYEVMVPNTSFGDLMICQVFGADGEVISQKYANSRSNVTHVYFETKVSIKEAKCAYARVVETDHSSP
ncbi:hypothetical protein [Parasulfitobacter algicola]|nr:hypothetical protein [Sulfitobacter algicola]